MRVRVAEEERWPEYVEVSAEGEAWGNDRGVVVELPDKFVARWRAVVTEWEACQRIVSDACPDGL